MGLQYNVQILGGQTPAEVRGYSGEFPRAQYGMLPLITGMLSEKVAEEGWSQLVDAWTAQWILCLVGEEVGINVTTRGVIIRVTIA